ncbi:Drug/metabolite transporter [Corchorus capsularis]|uniref:WAT1-related protein n=1 Tax=Corchorus capsularis TaxID=210143 RepID=A0A1R3GLE5_COCAP|nr:Drug/metabolite transporter [Corchorus capsularis]
MVVASALISPFAIVLERKSRPKMTFKIFAKIMLISLFEPVLDHNCFYTGMKYTTATFSTAMCNILPTLTFILACIFKLEKVELRKVQSQAKVVGTLVTVGGAMMMTFIKGTTLHPPWTKGRNHRGQSRTGGAHQEDLLKGSLLLIAGCCCWSFFIISQAVIIKSYPAKLSLTALICTMGAVEGAILALAVERNDTSVWQIHLDSKLVAVLYGGLVSAFAIYTMGSVMKKRGPVFVSAFNPLSMVIVAILGSFFLAEEMYMGRVIGSIVIVIGLYLVLWGKSKDQMKSKPDAGTVEHSDQQMAVIENTEAPPDLESITIEANRVRPIKESDRIDMK